MKIGIFKGRAIEAALCGSKGGSGSEYIGIVMQVAEGDCKGEEVGGRLFWTEKTQEQTRKALAHLGWKGEVDADGTLVGLPNVVDFGVVEDTYGGRTSLKVDWVGEPRMGGINQADRLSMRDASQMLKAMRAGLGGNGSSSRQRPPASGGGEMREPGDDDY